MRTEKTDQIWQMAWLFSVIIECLVQVYLIIMLYLGSIETGHAISETVYNEVFYIRTIRNSNVLANITGCLIG